jgi:hypothetical protein
MNRKRGWCNGSIDFRSIQLSDGERKFEVGDAHFASATCLPIYIFLRNKDATEVGGFAINDVPLLLISQHAQSLALFDEHHTCTCVARSFTIAPTWPPQQPLSSVISLVLVHVTERRLSLSLYLLLRTLPTHDLFPLRNHVCVQNIAPCTPVSHLIECTLPALSTLTLPRQHLKTRPHLPGT